MMNDPITITKMIVIKIVQFLSNQGMPSVSNGCTTLNNCQSRFVCNSGLSLQLIPLTLDLLRKEGCLSFKMLSMSGLEDPASPADPSTASIAASTSP